MTSLLYSVMAIIAALCAAAGIVLTALADPRVFTRPGLACIAASAVVSSALALGSRKKVGRFAELSRSEEGLRTKVAAFEAKLATQAQQLREMATTDELTGTLKRRAFLERLDEMVKRDARLRRPCVLLMVDVEGFKAINAKAGPLGGDTVLKEVAHALLSMTRGTDFVGRWDGDKFVVALGECEDPQPVVGRLHVALDGAVDRMPGSEKVHVSVGAALVPDPSAGVDLGALLRTADQALASVSGAGEGRFAQRVLEASSHLSARA